jgi:hypothetical protein
LQARKKLNSKRDDSIQSEKEAQIMRKVWEIWINGILREISLSGRLAIKAIACDLVATLCFFLWRSQ